ncbi:MAG: hypothetical protein HYR96_04960 [Deltaproteobacteria bacterium]|nr:hypothetical protein [Deltaproteobacteria bacterium]MBI3294562.1 hypothetical protein [Deltaproteobacteria bacterium]
MEDRTLVIRTVEDPKKASLVLRLTAKYLKGVSGDQVDGLVELGKQNIPGLKSPVITLSGADHALPCSSPIGRFAQRRQARAFDTALIHTVFRP